MKKNFRHIIFITAVIQFTAVFGVSASVTINDLSKLKQEPQHELVAKRVSSLFSRSHYKFILLNDEFSKKIFDRYIEQLDFNKSFFLQSDIDELKAYQYSFDDNLQDGLLDPVYIIYHRNLKRRFERFTYAISLLQKEIKFTDKDFYQFDRSESTWAIDQNEIDLIWQKKVKYDALSLKLNGKKWNEIKEQLTKRYERTLKRLTQVESEDVFQSFMNAYSHTIEPHTSYLSPRNAERFKVDMNLSLEGIGAVLQLDDDYTLVRSLVKGGPAERSKQISKDDKIIGVGQEGGEIVDIVGWRLDDVVDLIKGAKGTTVRLEILSGKSTQKNKIVKLVREKIHLEDREAKGSVQVIDGKKIGVISIPSFYIKLSEDVNAELKKLIKQKVKGVVVDLRNNGGGALSEASLLTGLFIDSGPVVQVRDSRDKVTIHQDNDGMTTYSGPLTVLINRYSASASEIFAAALQDHGRAIILGEQSYGKGTVQQHRQISRFYDPDPQTFGSVQYTIAKFYRINGGSTQNKGVTPDILFPTPIEHDETGESLEKNALPWDSIKAADYEEDNLTRIIAKLQKKHTKRIAKSPEFNNMLDDIAEYKKEKDEKTISLVESERIKTQNIKEAELLNRTNEQLGRAGLGTIKTIEDLPDDFEPIDAYLVEAAAITLDYSK